MFKIFVTAYLMSGGMQVAHGVSNQKFETREECLVVANARGASDHGAKYLQEEISKAAHAEVSVTVTCEKVDHDGNSEERL